MIMKKKILIGIGVFFALCITAFLIYVNIYSHATAKAEEYLEDSSTVKVEAVKTGYFFDGPGDESAFVFYPGGKVEHTAYAPIMHMLAEKGVDCFLVKMPFRLAVFGMNKAGKILENYDYENWYIGGHSLGGAMASAHASKNHNDFDGVILLGAYSTKILDYENMRVLSVYGSNDKVLNTENYRVYTSNLPTGFTEVVIDGGNHAGFGDYGQQKGDGNATISHEEQWNITVNAIVEFINQ